MPKIFATGISQESNSFNPLKTTKADFDIKRGKDFREMPGVAALLEAGCEVVESIFARAVPGGTLRQQDFLELADEMLLPLEEDKTGFDGVFLPMHGALDVEGIGSGEAFIAARVREIVGPNVPIAAPLDMHGNITYALAAACNIIYGFRTAPHIDVAQTHIRAALLLKRAIDEGVLPQTKIIRVPVKMPGENMMTASGPGREVIGRLPAIEGKTGVWCASYFVGMAWVDTYYNGGMVVISGVGNMGAGMAKGHELAKFIMDNRHDFKYQGLAAEVDEALEFVKKYRKDGPVIVSDSADNVTAGAAGDNAFLLNRFYGAGIKKALFAAITDPAFVKKACARNKVESEFSHVSIGGCFDKKSEAASFQKAAVRKISSVDGLRSCVLSYRGIDILVFEKRSPVFTEEVLAAHGLSLADYQILVVKQGYLSPELAAAAKHSVMALTPGNCDQRLERLEYKKSRV